MNRETKVLAAVLLAAVVAVSLFLVVNSPSKKQTLASPFYVGVEFAYGNQFSQVKALVDRVENFTNLIILAVPSLTFNRSALDESCNYIYNAKLNFIVQITSLPMYNATDGFPPDNSVFDWIGNATQKYGKQFLGIYRFDEPGGNQLDSGKFQLINSPEGGYSGVANNFVGNLSTIINYYHENAPGGVQIFTSDYGLYWFDYASNYNAVFAELTVNQTRFGQVDGVSNQTKQQVIALDRGAAQSFHKQWGVIVTWQYNQTPYLESGSDLYLDLAQAYCAGANYAVVFSYPNITVNGAVDPYGILTDEHFGNMSKFWSDIHNNTVHFVASPPEVAYVVPKDYGYGFRSASDTIWGLFPPDQLTPKVWSDVQFLDAKYSFNLNIIYADPSVVTSAELRSYKTVYYYNQTVT